MNEKKKILKRKLTLTALINKILKINMGMMGKRINYKRYKLISIYFGHRWKLKLKFILIEFILFCEFKTVFKVPMTQ